MEQTTGTTVRNKPHCCSGWLWRAAQHFSGWTTSLLAWMTGNILPVLGIISVAPCPGSRHCCLATAASSTKCTERGDIRPQCDQPWLSWYGDEVTETCAEHSLDGSPSSPTPLMPALGSVWSWCHTGICVFTLWDPSQVPHCGGLLLCPHLPAELMWSC